MAFTGATGTTILATEFNTLVSDYNLYWSDDHSSVLWTEADKTNHKNGWGQAAVEPTVSISDIITAEQTNRLIAQENSGLLHTGLANLGVAAEFITKYAVETVIPASAGVKIDAKTTLISADKFGLGANYGALDLALQTTTATPVWSDEVYCVFKNSFTNYNEARYFFNSGGQLTVDLNATGEVDSDADLDLTWQTMFSRVGEIYIGAESCTNTKPNNPVLSLGGFYSFNDYNWHEVCSRTGVIFDSEYGGGAYGGATEYVNRKIIIEIKIEEPLGAGNVFDVYVKIRLIDDIIDSVGNNDATLEADMGHKHAIEACTDAELTTSNGDPFKAGSYTYQFQERTVPTVTVDEPWTVIA